MILGIAEIILGGMAFEWLARKLKAPGLLGLLLLGLLAGPFAFNLIDPGIYAVATDLRLVALVVILFRAGFEMNRQQLARVGVRAALMAFIPCLCETAVVTCVASWLLPLTLPESAILGAVLAAVSPAVIVPYMIRFKQEGRGTDKGIPTLVLAGASCDDAVAIVLCGAFTVAYIGQPTGIATQIASIPVSVVTGVGIGLVLGYVVHRFFKTINPRATKRLLLLLALAILLTQVQPAIEAFVPYSALMSIMAIGIMIYELEEQAAWEMSVKLAKLWIFAQLLLFVLVGAQVDITLVRSVGWGSGGYFCRVAWTILRCVALSRALGADLPRKSVCCLCLCSQSHGTGGDWGSTHGGDGCRRCECHPWKGHSGSCGFEYSPHRAAGRRADSSWRAPFVDTLKIITTSLL